MSITDASIGQVITFEVYPAAILGSSFDRVKVEAIVSAPLARQLGFDVDSVHASVYPTLPVGTTDSAGAYSYLIGRLPNDTPICIGLPWIKPSTIVVVESITATVVVSDMRVGDITLLRDILLANGFRSIKITT